MWGGSQKLPPPRSTAERREGSDHSAVPSSLSGRFSFWKVASGWILVKPRAWTSLSGTQINRSCCSGVFVDQSAESVVSVKLVWWVRSDESYARAWCRCCEPQGTVRVGAKLSFAAQAPVRVGVRPLSW
jgi:hypothetical protein